MITLEDALRVAGFGDPSNYPGDWIPMTEPMLHKFALAIEAEIVERCAKVCQDRYIIDHGLIAAIRALQPIEQGRKENSKEEPHVCSECGTHDCFGECVMSDMDHNN